MRLSTLIAGAAALGTLFVLAVPRWHRPVDGTQLGYRASSMIQWAPTEPVAIAFNAPPPAVPPDRFGVDQAALDDTRPATTAYPGVHVPDGTTAGEFMRLQVAFTQWTSPKQGCAFCHAGTDWKSEEKPQKQMARIMTDMVRSLNTDWSAHNAEAGVTCYSCHRGQNVPAVAWYPHQAPVPRHFVAKEEDWNYAATTVHDFFPDNGYAEYLLQATPGHVQANTALATTGPQSQYVFARLYEYMMQMSDEMGVNCGYCHNSRAFFDWGQSTPHRWIGLSGIEMTRAINRNVLLPLAAAMPQTRQVPGDAREPIVPAHETGAQTGNALAVCGTCHYGSPKPLNGLNLVHDHQKLLVGPPLLPPVAQQAAALEGPR